MLAAALMVLTAARAAATVSLDLPNNAVQTAEVVRAQETYPLPIGSYKGGQVPVLEVQGRFEQRAWMIAGTTLTSLQIIDPIRKALEEAGFEIRLFCESRTCGEFDFRFALDILPAPAMFVDIFDYRALSAVHPDGRVVSVLVSRVTSDAFVQITQVSPEDTEAMDIAKGKTAQPEPGPQFDSVRQGIGATLVTQGHAVLGDLEFATGSDSLVDADYASLKALAEFLIEDSQRKVILVGHTDAIGDLAGNVNLSRRRAAAVVERLKTRYGIGEDQLDAGGMGYMAPETTNLTPEGRSKNRRVEAVLLNTEE